MQKEKEINRFTTMSYKTTLIDSDGFADEWKSRKRKFSRRMRYMNTEDPNRFTLRTGSTDSKDSQKKEDLKEIDSDSDLFV